MRWNRFFVVIFVAVVSGCMSPSGIETTMVPPMSDGPSPAGPVVFGDSTGAINGLVHDDELRPIPSVTIAFADGGASTTSDMDGRFVFSNVLPGSIELVATKEGYGGTRLFVIVNAGEASSVGILLSTHPIQEGYYVTKLQRGILGCAVSSDAGGFAGCDAWEFFGVDLSQYIPDQYELVWPLSEDVSDLQALTMEMEWQSTQSFGRMMLFTWNVKGCYGWDDETLGTAAGASALHDFADRSNIEVYLARELSPCDSPGVICNEEAGCTLVSMVFAHPSAVGGSAPVDVAIIWQQSFVQYQTEFYFRPGSPDFRAIPDQ